MGETASLAGGNGANDRATQAKVKYEKISSGQFPDEVVVTVVASHGALTAIFPSSSVDIEARTVSVFVLEERPDSYLVDLPTYTFSSGSTALFPKASVIL